MSDSKGAAIKEQILKIVNDNRCDDHRCSKVADLNEKAAQAILALLAQEVKRAQVEEVQHEIDFLLDDYKRTDDYNLKMAANRMEARLHTIRKAGLV